MATQNIQLKDGSNNHLMPKTTASLTTYLQGDSESDIQSVLQDVGGTERQAIYSGYSTTAGTAWNLMGVYGANSAYKFDGYVVRVHVYATNPKIVYYGTMDTTNSYAATKKGQIYLDRGWNHVDLIEPVRVTTTNLFCIANDNVSSSSNKCLTFVSISGQGSYYNGSYHASVVWQYYLDYVTTEEGEKQIAEKVAEQEIYVNGGTEVIAPDITWYNADGSNNPQNTRGKYEWNKTVKAGDVFTVQCNTGWKAGLYVINTTNNTVLRTCKAYTGGTWTLQNFDGDGKVLRIIIQKDNSSATMTVAEFKTNVKVTVSREHKGVDNQKEISVLFIGNSLTQDAVSYVPLLMQRFAPDVRFRFYMWYIGGYTLSQQLTAFQNNTKASIFSVCENSVTWTNYENSKTMADVLATYKFDIVSLQEYFNYKSTYSDADKQTYLDVISYIRNNYSGVFKVATFFHQPKRDVAESVFNLTKSSLAWQMRNTITESIIPSGIAIYRAMATDLDALGDQGHLSVDGTHAQEGLPCLIQAQTTLLWIYEQLGIARSIANTQQSVVSFYNEINVPGANLGSGVIAGTADERTLATDVAIKSWKEGYSLQINNLVPNEND